MKIVHDWPPHIAEIEKQVPDFRKNKNILTSYGDTIYNPSGKPIPEDVMKHEEVHGRQHAAYPGGAAAFSARCLLDKDFYLKSELEAYQAQYLYLCSVEKGTANRKKTIAQRMAYRLRNPVYGFNLSQFDAVELILGVWRSAPEQSPLPIAKNTMDTGTPEANDTPTAPSGEMGTSPSSATPVNPEVAPESEADGEGEEGADPAEEGAV